MKLNNTLELAGKIVESFQYDHTIKGEDFYQTKVEVERLSEVTDVISLIVSSRLIDISKDWCGMHAEVRGSFRSHNTPEGRCILYAFADSIKTFEEKIESVNKLYLRGIICRSVNYRKTPLGRDVADVLIAVNRQYGKSDYIPSIMWGRNATYADCALQVADEIEVEGRVQSRNYLKTIGEAKEVRTAYEVSICKVTKLAEGGDIYGF